MMMSRLLTRQCQWTRTLVASLSNQASQPFPRAVDCSQGEKVVPTFSKGEMNRRIGNLRQHMAQHNIDTCLLTSYHNVNYFCDFVYCAFGRPYAVVINHDNATLLVSTVDYGQPYRRFHGGKTINYTDWQRDNYFHAIQNTVAGAKRIGYEGDHLPVDSFEKLKQLFPVSTEYADVGQAAMHLRSIKSAEEIAITKEGARVADIGGAAGKAAIGLNVAEYEVAEQSTNAMVQEIAKSFPHSELMNTWSWVQGGINTDGAHNPVTTRRLQNGDIISLNCFPMIAGYYTALERSLFLGTPSKRTLEVWEANCKVHRRGLELLKPGAKCSDIARELNEIFASRDLLPFRTFGYGHSFGTLCHYYGREAAVELREDVDTVLQPGMVVSMEPMIVIPHGQDGAGGYREHDIVVITENGGENITRFPFGPQHNIIAA